MTTSPAAPLRNISVLVTRPLELADSLIDLIRKMGAETIHWPALTLAPTGSEQAAEARTRLLESDILVFSSQPAVKFALRLLDGSMIPGATKLVAVGPSTAKLLNDAGYNAEYPASDTGSEAVLDCVGLKNSPGRQVGIVCAPGGRHLMARKLIEAGAHVTAIETYLTITPTLGAVMVAQLDGVVNRLWITATSVRILENIKTIVAPQLTGHLLQRPTIVPGHRLFRAALELGYERVIAAQGPLPQQMVNALVSAQSNSEANQ